MKRSGKSVLFFLAAWLVVVMAGYLLSHGLAFAAPGPPPNCAQCIWCQEFDTFNGSGIF